MSADKKIIEFNNRGLLNISPDNFKALIHFKSLRALADPGEAVGLLAAQVNFKLILGYNDIPLVRGRALYSDDLEYLSFCWKR